MIGDVFLTQKNRQRPFFNSDAILANFDKGERFSRKGWGLLSLELWHQTFHDRAAEFRARLDAARPDMAAQ
jgi:asparagine synthase (glutamine-hydrolysing)